MNVQELACPIDERAANALLDKAHSLLPRLAPSERVLVDTALVVADYQYAQSRIDDIVAEIVTTEPLYKMALSIDRVARAWEQSDSSFSPPHQEALNRCLSHLLTSVQKLPNEDKTAAVAPLFYGKSAIPALAADIAITGNITMLDDLIDLVNSKAFAEYASGDIPYYHNQLLTALVRRLMTAGHVSHAIDTAGRLVVTPESKTSQLLARLEAVLLLPVDNEYAWEAMLDAARTLDEEPEPFSEPSGPRHMAVINFFRTAFAGYYPFGKEVKDIPWKQYHAQRLCAILFGDTMHEELDKYRISPTHQLPRWSDDGGDLSAVYFCLDMAHILDGTASEQDRSTRFCEKARTIARGVVSAEKRRTLTNIVWARTRNPQDAHAFVAAQLCDTIQSAEVPHILEAVSYVPELSQVRPAIESIRMQHPHNRFISGLIDKTFAQFAQRVAAIGHVDEAMEAIDVLSQRPDAHWELVARTGVAHVLLGKPLWTHSVWNVL